MNKILNAIQHVRNCDCPCPLHTAPPPRLMREPGNSAKPLADVIPIPTDVVLYPNDEGFGASNVPFYSRQYECSGPRMTTWGYAGHGPHSLAADILQWFGMEEKEADHWAGEIVIEFLSFIPEGGATIPREKILKIIEEIRSGKRKHWREAGEDPYVRIERNEISFLVKGGF
jgi:hypothetical protein